MHLEKLQAAAADETMQKTLAQLVPGISMESMQYEFDFFNDRRCDSLYRNMTVKKRGGGFRNIQAPWAPLKRIQQAMLPLLTNEYLPEYIHGPMARMDSIKCLRNACDNFSDLNGPDAQPRAVFHTDIRNFFPSITTNHIRPLIENVLRESSVPESQREEATEIVLEVCTIDGHLPQGAPTSPSLANMLGASAFDTQIRQLLQEIQSDAVYMRYADDITILGTSEVKLLVRQGIRDILEAQQFEMSDRKTSYVVDPDYHSILGLHIPRQDDGPIRFRLRPLIARRWASRILHITSFGSKFIPERLSKRSRKLNRVFGRLAYAARVGKFGEDTAALAKGSYLPKPLDHAWNCFCDEFYRYLPNYYNSWFRRERDLFSSE